MKNFAPTLSQIQPAPVGKPFDAYNQDELREAIRRTQPFKTGAWVKPSGNRSSTIKDAVCEVMCDGVERSLAEIIADAKDECGIHIRASSLSSTLSRLVESGLIVRRGETYNRTFIWVGETSE